MTSRGYEDGSGLGKVRVTLQKGNALPAQHSESGKVSHLE